MFKYALVAVAIAFIVAILGGLVPLNGNWDGRLINETSGGWTEVSLAIWAIPLENDQGFPVIKGEIYYGGGATYDLSGLKLSDWRFTLKWDKGEQRHDVACVIEPFSLLWRLRAVCKGSGETLRLVYRGE